MAANASAALYAGVNVGDIALAVVSLFNALCCCAVLLLALHKRSLRPAGRDGADHLAAIDQRHDNKSSILLRRRP
jgi:hypothetical protein